MPRRTRAAAVTAVLSLAALGGLAACSEDPAADTGLPATTTATVATTATTAPATTATTAPATTATTAPPSTATTAVYSGLPTTLPVPVAGLLQLTGGTTFSDGFTVTGVEAVDVLGWVVGQLPEAGWAVTEQVVDEGDRRRYQATVEFEARGAAGTLLLAQRPDGVTVDFVLTARSLGG